MKPIVIGKYEFEHRTGWNNESSTFGFFIIQRFWSEQQKPGLPLLYSSTLFELSMEKLVGIVKSVVMDKNEFEHRVQSKSIAPTGHFKLSWFRYTEKTTVYKLRIMLESHSDWGLNGWNQPCCYRERTLWRLRKISKGISSVQISVWHQPPLPHILTRKKN